MTHHECHSNCYRPLAACLYLNGGAPAGPDYGNDLALEFNIASDSETLTIPAKDHGTFNAEIDWGDGSPVSTITTWNDADLAHVYATAGVYTVRISGNFPRLKMNDNPTNAAKLLRVLQLGAVGALSYENMFQDCANLTSIESPVTDMSAFGGTSGTRYICKNCASLTSVNITNFVAPLNASFYAAFQLCTSLTSINIKDWDTSLAKSYDLMFNNTGLVSIDLTGVITSYATGVPSMFSNSPSLTSVTTTGCDFSSVTNFGSMFQSCSSLTTLDVTNWVTSAATVINGMFRGASSLTSLDASSWVTTNCTSISYMFYQCGALTTVDVSTWNTANMTNMQNVFYGCSALTALDISGWTTPLVTNFNNTFYNCQLVTTIDVSGWSFAAATNMTGMFSNCKALTSVTFSATTNFNLVTTMASLFTVCNALTSVTNLVVTSACTNMSSMFDQCTVLPNSGISFSGWNTSNVTIMGSCFRNTYLLDDIAIDGFNITSLTNAANMFLGAGLLTSRYDAVLIAWEGQVELTSVAAHFGSSKYTSGGAAEAARTALVSTSSWTITDGGAA